MTDAIWKALADPTRRAILDELRGMPKTTGELCDLFGHLDRCTVMKHLEVLVHCSLVVVERRGRTRLNHLNPAPLVEVVSRWMVGQAPSLLEAAARLKLIVEETRT